MLAVLFWMLDWERLAGQYAACQLELEFHKTVRVPGGKTLPVYNDPKGIAYLTGVGRQAGRQNVTVIPLYWDEEGFFDAEGTIYVSTGLLLTFAGEKALDALLRSESRVKHAKQQMRATRTASACAALARPEKRYTLEVLQLEIRKYRQENSPRLRPRMK